MNTVRLAPQSASVQTSATTLAANGARRQLLISNGTGSAAYINFTTSAGASGAGNHHLSLAAGANFFIEGYTGPAKANAAVDFTEFI